MPRSHVYHPGEQPLVEVLHEGAWVWGELRMVVLEDDDTLSLQVRWHPSNGVAYISRFELDQVRPVDDHSGIPVDPATVWPWNRTTKPTDSSAPA